VHTALFDTVRSQDYIIQTGSFVPDVFRQRNWTIGAHLFVEAIMNFGRLGPYIVLAVFAAALTWLERVARKSYTLFLGYAVTASMGFDLAWYGFGNWLKEAIFAALCGAVIILAGKLTARDGIARPKFRNSRLS
jgi:membrane protein DedA with SNARE-associated domain